MRAGRRMNERSVACAIGRLDLTFASTTGCAAAKADPVAAASPAATENVMNSRREGSGAASRSFSGSCFSSVMFCPRRTGAAKEIKHLVETSRGLPWLAFIFPAAHRPGAHPLSTHKRVPDGLAFRYASSVVWSAIILPKSAACRRAVRRSPHVENAGASAPHPSPHCRSPSASPTRARFGSRATRTATSAKSRRISPSASKRKTRTSRSPSTRCPSRRSSSSCRCSSRRARAPTSRV